MSSNESTTPWQELQDLLQREAACKQGKTCPRLEVRELFFEPNHHTLSHWRKHGTGPFYTNGIDRRLVFVAESPSNRRPRSDAADFNVGGQRGWRCWDYTRQDANFREARERHGFQDCLITNAVKCGPLRLPAKLTDKEASSCSQFLRAELEAIKPFIVACVGGSAMKLFQSHTLPSLSFNPVVVRVPHYSFRGGKTAFLARWDAEFARIKVALAARGVSPDEPLYLHAASV